MSGFSSALQLADLDDFITPSQECIKPVQIQKDKSKTGSKITIKEDGYYAETQSGSQKLQKVEITLQDCLACSGCITSAEGVLITQQSQEELLKVLRHNQELKASGSTEQVKTIVFTLSQQPVLSLAQRYQLDVEDAAKHLSGYFRQLGADLILSTKIADDLALIESRNEFIERYREGNTENIPFPMISSSCPGWVCYAEKTHGNFILPYISTTRSPQQINGILVKQWLAQKLGIPTELIYHVTVMPCYDKKLEASREDFYSEVNNSRDVDCVMTSIEIEQMLNVEDKSLSAFEQANFDWPWSNDVPETNVWAYELSSSGGYCDHLFQYAAKELFNTEIEKLEYKTLRNPDFREIILENDGKILLKFAIVYGFRNIQNLVQKLKRGKIDYHFVEIMACPSGCMNGGAQIRPPTGKNNRELTLQLEQLYDKLPRSIPDNNETKNIYKKFFDGSHTDKAKMLLHTSYHAVQKMSTALNIKW